MLTDFVNLFYPTVCYACDEPLVKGESQICTYCRGDLPKTNFHINSFQGHEHQFYELQSLRYLLPYLKFVKGGKVQKLLHELKYGGKREISDLMGRWYGQDLKTAGYDGVFDIVLPIPLHRSKLLKRGYNQCEGFAITISASLGAETILHVLKKSTATTTQTNKSRFGRFSNVERVFHVENPELLENKNVLIVDDVLTTGATIRAAVEPILECGVSSLSVATIAIAWK